MSLEIQPGRKPLVPPPSPPWGEVTAGNEVSNVVRFVLSDRVVTFPFSELRRWEHLTGEEEKLVITAGRERVIVEGAELGAICAALEQRRLREVRGCAERIKSRPGPRVRRIVLETP